MQHVKFKFFQARFLTDIENELNLFASNKDVINCKLTAADGILTALLAYRDLADAENDPRPRR